MRVPKSYIFKFGFYGLYVVIGMYSCEDIKYYCFKIRASKIRLIKYEII